MSKPEYLPLYGLDRCPQCGIAKPNLYSAYAYQTSPEQPLNTYFYDLLRCATCNHATLVKAQLNRTVAVWPEPKQYSADIPQRARGSLKDAAETIGTPSLSIIGAARAVDFMLSEKGFPGGKGTNLAARINEAAAKNVITADMKAWADEVRLDANAERHADAAMPDPTKEDAERALRFAEALAELLFELPARVRRGRGKSNGKPL